LLGSRLSFDRPLKPKTISWRLAFSPWTRSLQLSRLFNGADRCFVARQNRSLAHSQASTQDQHRARSADQNCQECVDAQLRKGQHLWRLYHNERRRYRAKTRVF